MSNPRNSPFPDPIFLKRRSVPASSYPVRCRRKLSARLFNHVIALFPTLFGMTIGWGMGSATPVLAESKNLSSSSSEVCPINLNLLKSNLQPDRIVTADSVSPQAITWPSFWWTSEQFPDRLISNWIADAAEKEVYLLINPQYWSGLDYIDRYHLIDRFGRVARGYGYNLKLCTPQKVALANYTCKLDNPQSSCQIWLKASDGDGLGVNISN